MRISDWSSDVCSSDLVFIAGVGPGILLAGCLIGYVWWYARRNGLGKHDGDGRLPIGESFLRAWWALLMPVLILGGIYGGEIGKATCRERGCQDVSISVVADTLTKKRN